MKSGGTKSSFSTPASHKDIKPAKRMGGRTGSGSSYTGMEQSGGNGGCYTGMHSGSKDCSGSGKNPSRMRTK